GRWGKLLWMVTLQVGVGGWAWGTLSPKRVHVAASLPEVRAEAMLGGLQRILDLPQHGWSEGLFQWMFLLALAGGLMPGRRLGRRSLVAVGAIAVVLATAAALDRRVRPRLLLASCYALVVMVGVAAAVASTWLSRFRLRHVPLLVVPAVLGLDAWAWAHDLAERRMRFAEAAPPGFGPAPQAFASRYGRANWSALRDLTLAGGVPLHHWVGQHAGGAVATLRLRDDRHRNLDAAAGLAGATAVLLDRGRCCAGLPETQCAIELVDALDRAGVALALPLQTQAVRRVNKHDDGWLAALQSAAAERGTAEALGTWWQVVEPSGSGGSVPCAKQSTAPRKTSWSWPPPLPETGGGPAGRQRPQQKRGKAIRGSGRRGAPDEAPRRSVPLRPDASGGG
ncbi:MAG: hypothetical protein VX000_16335, partial [Myxococcota bacterium]|nr:hypothetical protein [Myxococcota bacterium]